MLSLLLCVFQVDQTFTFPTMFRDFLKQREEQILEKEEEEKQMKKLREKKDKEDAAKLHSMGLEKEQVKEQEDDEKGKLPAPV